MKHHIHISGIGVEACHRARVHRMGARVARQAAAACPVAGLVAGASRRRVMLPARHRRLLRDAAMAQRVLLRMSESLREARAEVASLQAQALHDALTGLPNRRRLEQFWTEAAASRRAGDTSLSVLVVDVDAFKAINDGHSHAVGDAVLRAVGGILQGHVRREDLAVRLGGDEFVVVLRESEPGRGKHLARRIQAAVAAHDWRAIAPGLSVSVSVGATRGPVKQPLEALLLEADLAMYGDKRGRRPSTVDA